jgi:hypothetical protein
MGRYRKQGISHSKGGEIKTSIANVLINHHDELLKEKI